MVGLKCTVVFSEPPKSTFLPETMDYDAMSVEIVAVISVAVSCQNPQKEKKLENVRQARYASSSAADHKRTDKNHRRHN